MASSGCGRKDEPLPPIRLIPAAASDLTVAQRGNDLVLTSKYPNVTTSGMALPGLEAVEVWQMRAPAPLDGAPLREAEFLARAQQITRLQGGDLSAAVSGGRLAIRIPAPPPGEISSSATAAEDGAEGAPGDTEDPGTVAQSPSDAFTYALRFLSSGGEISAFSNRATVVPLAAPAPPTGLQLAAAETGVEVTWSGAGPAGSRIYRRSAQQPLYGAPIATIEADTKSYLDGSARFGERYIYSVTALAASEPPVESLVAEEREIEYLDRFAPPPPAGLLALAESVRIRLSWQAVVAPDVTGYHVYRSIGDGAFERLTAEPQPAPSYLDATPGTAQRSYEVTAIDGEGNESEPSEPATARLRSP